MSSKSHERTQERRIALRVLYQGEILDTSPLELIEKKLLVDEDALMGDYAKSLLVGCIDHTEDIDTYLVAASENWAIDRMPLVDKSLLRLATFEMKYVDDVPVSVAINEAVNLAKEFGGADSPRFVNGILGRIAVQLEEEVASE